MTGEPEIRGVDPLGSVSEDRRLVLVADDELVIRRIVARMLEEEGYKVREAADGLEAFELIRARPGDYDVLVSDVIMPRLNGVELLQRLSVAYPDLPCILMSGYGGHQLAAMGIAAPCAMLSKPILPDLLLAEVRRCSRPRP